MDIYKIKKGLRLRLAGEAHRSTREVAPSTEYAVRPADFGGMTPKVLVKVGDAVLVGTPLFVDKATEQVKVVSPVSGTIIAVERGERRKLLSIRIQPDSVQVAKDFELPVNDGEAVVRLLLESGLFAYLRQRPYDVVPTPGVAPRDIFVSAFSSMPLAADFTYVAAGQEVDFKAGIAALAKVAPVHLGVNDEQLNTPLLPISAPQVTVACFRGPNPAGNVGVQINRVAPVNKGETVWTMAPEAVIFLGRLLRTGKLDFTRTIAVGGSEIEAPQYARVKVGVGQKATMDDFLGAQVTEVTVIPEGDDVHEVLGWIRPRLDSFSTSRSYFSWLSGKKPYTLDCRVKGGERHMIMSAEYESVFPMDIYPSYLIKAIITGDIDRQEALGIYEVAPEDFAPAEFVCSSKLELQRIVREGLDLLRKENA